MTISIASLLVTETKAAIYSFALGVARAISLPVDSWQAGDPTRSLYHVLSEKLSILEVNAAGYVASAWLDHATGEWLKVLAEQVYGVVVPGAIAATTTVRLTNASTTNLYTFDAGDLIFSSADTGKTYKSTAYYDTTTATWLASGTLAIGPGTILDVTVVAEELGSDSSAGAGEITVMVTPYDGVTCTNATAAVGIDEQSASVTKQQCRDMQDMLSPNGAKGAYSYVVRNPDFGGTSAITRVRVFGDSTTGIVTMYLAGPSGGSSAADVALAELAVVTWCTPLCFTPILAAATNVTVAVTYELWVYKSCNKTADEVRSAVSDALGVMFAERPIGGDVISPATTGKLYQSMVSKTILDALPQGFRVSVTVPSGDTALTNGQVAVVGTVTGTIHLENDP
jgi:hypothetical protein